MEQFVKIVRQIFLQSVSSNPAETVAFFFFIVLFVGGLFGLNARRKKREKEHLRKSLDEKWEHLCKKYELTEEEIEFLLKLAQYLKAPEKKYLLLVNIHVFNSCLHWYTLEHGTEEQISRTILFKTDMRPISGHMKDHLKGIAVQRREKVRKKVDILARVAHVDHREHEYKARIHDIGSGGASIENPDKLFHTGNDLKISFTLHDKEYHDIPAEVVRVSSSGRMIHVSFAHFRKE